MMRPRVKPLAGDRHRGEPSRCTEGEGVYHQLLRALRIHVAALMGPHVSGKLLALRIESACAAAVCCA
eukprot:CAMPEP_0174731628 /NCGR_PEP_ID=MMETSP1094-20130205/57894_1 /TAXON_ID=156173 /ORGANISM="Chrysochromulina brevifilum, Strain UTEX LB 985" /LENGTH=67 /DNA_ID=CAMNT_0015934039 /DNA_START=383 /DNA_END=582 /DNA_ORIENTATION=-